MTPPEVVAELESAAVAEPVSAASVFFAFATRPSTELFLFFPTEDDRGPFDAERLPTELFEDERGSLGLLLPLRRTVDGTGAPSSADDLLPAPLPHAGREGIRCGAMPL